MNFNAITLFTIGRNTAGILCGIFWVYSLATLMWLAIGDISLLDGIARVSAAWVLCSNFLYQYILSDALLKTGDNTND